MKKSPTEPSNKTHHLVWIKVTKEQANELDSIASQWELTRASLCRLIVSSFLRNPESSLTVRKDISNLTQTK